MFKATLSDGITQGDNLCHRRKRAISMIGEGEKPAKMLRKNGQGARRKTSLDTWRRILGKRGMTNGPVTLTIGR